MFQWMVVQFNHQRAAQVTCDQQLAVWTHRWWENSKKTQKWWKYTSLKKPKNPWPGYGGQWSGYGSQWSGYAHHWPGYGSHWPGYGAHPWNVQNMSRFEVSVMILTDSWDMQSFCTTNIISDWLKLANSISCPFGGQPATYLRSVLTLSPSSLSALPSSQNSTSWFSFTGSRESAWGALWTPLWLQRWPWRLVIASASV